MSYGPSYNSYLVIELLVRFYLPSLSVICSFLTTRRSRKGGGQDCVGVRPGSDSNRMIL